MSSPAGRPRLRLPSRTAYTATYRKVVDLSRLSGNYTAVDGDVMINSTTYSVTIPAGASVTMNGVTVNGASGGESTPAPMAGGVEVKEKKSAVMTTIEVTTEAPTQFFKVKFGE